MLKRGYAAPSFEDQSNLPYVAAFMQEVGRWRPVTAGGVQHRATEDVVYVSVATNSCRIRGGSSTSRRMAT